MPITSISILIVTTCILLPIKSLLLFPYYLFRCLCRYEKRKAYLEGMLAAEARKLENQARFVLEKIEGQIVIENKPKKVLVGILKAANYDSDPVRSWKECMDKLAAVEEELEAQALGGRDGEDDDESAEGAGGPDYNYILGMPLWSLTKERKDDLLAQRDKKQAELRAIKQQTPSMLWRTDLKALEDAYQVCVGEGEYLHHRLIFLLVMCTIATMYGGRSMLNILFYPYEYHNYYDIHKKSAYPRGRCLKSVGKLLMIREYYCVVLMSSQTKLR